MPAVMLMPAVQSLVPVTSAGTNENDGASQMAALASAGSPFSPSATESLAQLNSQLIHVLDELESKEKVVKKLEKDLEQYSRDYNKVKHQLGLLYEDHFKANTAWKKEKEGLEVKIDQMREAKEASLAKILEYEQLWDSLAVKGGLDGDEDQCLVRNKLAETARKIGLLKSNEAILTRKYTTLEAKERLLREENLQLRTELLQLENQTLQSIGTLQRAQEAASFKTDSLLKMLEESVPATAMEQANRQYNELTARYRDLLQQQATQCTQTRTLQELELQAGAFRQQKDTLSKELMVAKEKVVAMEALISAVGLRRSGGRGGEEEDQSSSNQLEIEGLAKKVGALIG
jgi:centrosomal protein CEP290